MAQVRREGIVSLLLMPGLAMTACCAILFAGAIEAACADSGNDNDGGACEAGCEAGCEPGKDDYYEGLFAASAAPVPSRRIAKRRPMVSGDTEGSCPQSEAQVCPQAKDIGRLARTMHDSELPVECIRSVMKLRPLPTRSIFYAKCETESSTETRKGVRPPCLSDAYVEFTRDAFVGTMRCLDEDPKELFGLFGQESGFQVNIGNSAGAWGVGQITRAAGAPQAFATRFEEYIDEDSCEPYRELLVFDEKRKKTTPCLLTLPPANPARNFLMGGLLFKAAKKTAAALVPKSAKGGDRARIARDLAMQMYNKGDAGIRACFKNYLIDNPGGASTYKRFSEGFTAYLAAHFGEGIKYFENHLNPKALDRARKEVSRYAARIHQVGRGANKDTGKECAR